MRYSAYKAKYAEKIKKLNLLYKLRFVFMGVGVAAIASTGTLLGIKGKVGETTTSQSVYYVGDKIEVDSSAIMSDYYIEYASKDGDNWSTEVPTKPGEYKARAVAKGSFGGDKHGKETYFEIKPRDVHVPISSTAATYGENPLLDLSEAQSYGLVLKNVNFTFGDKVYSEDPFGDALTFKEDVSLNTGSLRIETTGGEDVTDCYNVVSEAKSIEIGKREIVVDVMSKTKAYDGIALESGDDYQINQSYSLAFDDQLVTDTSSSLTEIGTADNNMTFRVINGEKDKTNFYKIRVNKGKLTVTKRKLVLETNSISREYNGYPLSKNANLSDNALTYTVGGDGLLPGHKLDNIIFDVEGKYVTPQSQSNSISLADLYIKDNDNNSVKDFYDVSLRAGTVNVTKRNLTVRFDGKAKVYDGYGLEADDPVITSGVLAETDSWAVRNKTSIASGINSAYIDDEFYITHEECGEVTDDFYNVVYSRGILTIKRIDITVSTNHITRSKYNGYALSSDSSAEPENRLSYTVSNGILPNHEFVPLGFSLEGKKVVAGAPNYLSFDIIDSSTHDSVLDLYNVTQDFPYVQIDKLHVTFRFEAVNQKYNGTSYTVPYTIDPSSDPIPETDYIYVSGNTFGPVADYYSFNPDVQIKDANGNDLTGYGENSCYVKNVYKNQSYVSITRSDLYIETNSINSIYNGKRLSKNALTSDRKLEVTNVTGLVPGHTIEVLGFDLEDQFIGGYYENSISYNILDANGDPVDKYEYYNIQENFGSVYIGPKPLTVTFDGLSKIYDGTPLPGAQINTDGLVEGDYLANSTTATSSGDIDSYYKSYYCSILGPLGDVTGCYSFVNSEYGSSTYEYYMNILPRNLYLTSQSVNKVYDSNGLITGESEGDLRYTIGAGSDSLLPGHTLHVNFDNAGIKNVCSNVTNSFSYYITDSSNNDVSYLYNVTRNYGKINITKRDLTINKTQYNGVYNAQLQGWDSIDVSWSGLAINDDISFNKYTNVGNYYDSGIINLTSKNYPYEDVKSNYNIISDVNENIRIDKLKIYYSVYYEQPGDTFTKTYDGYAIDESLLKLDIRCNSDSGNLPLGFNAVPDFVPQDVTHATAKTEFLYNLRVFNGYDEITYSPNIELHCETEKSGFYQIDKRHLGVYCNVDTTYDGNEHGGHIDDYGCSFTNLADGDHTENPIFNTVIYPITDLSGLLQSVTIRDTYGNNVTDSYYWDNAPSGTYNIGFRDFTISINDVVKTYNGYPVTNGDLVLNYDQSELASGDNIYVTVDTTLISQATLTNQTNNEFVNLPVTYKIYRNGNINNDVTGAYNVHLLNTPRFKINKRQLYFALYMNNSTLIYDAKQKSLEDFAYFGTGLDMLANNDQINYRKIYIKNAGECFDITMDNSTFNDYFTITSQLDGHDVSSNYDIIVENSSYYFNIVKRNASLVAHGISKIFDGDAVDVTNRSYGTSNFVSGHTISAEYYVFDSYSNLVDSSNIYDHGAYNLTLGNIHVFEGTTDVTNNYNISVVSSYVKIYQRVIKYRIIDSSFTYGTNNTITETIEFTPNNLTDDKYVKITSTDGEGGVKGTDYDSDVSSYVIDSKTNFFNNFDITSTLTPEVGTQDIVHGYNNYTFYRANGDPYVFHGELTATNGSETYSTSGNEPDDNIVFVKDGESYDNYLEIQTNRKTLTITNIENKVTVLPGADTRVLEQLSVDGLVKNTDTLYIGDEPYDKSTTEYAALNINRTDYSPGEHTLTPADDCYFNHVLNNEAVGSLIKVKRKVWTGSEYIYVDVTDCYNFNFNFKSSISFRVIAL